MKLSSSPIVSSAVNFRDLGEIPTKDGRKIAPRRLFRSGRLSELTQEDKALLSAFSVANILDLREHSEAVAMPDQLWEGVSYERISANPTELFTANPSYLISRFTSEEAAHDFMRALYRALPFDNAAYRRLVALLHTSDNKSILFHCSLGKDRTGVGSAILLLLLGATPKAIIEDYLLTEERISDLRRQWSGEWREDYTRDQIAAIHCCLSARRAFIEATLESILEKYSSFEDYIRQEFSIDDATIASIRDRYLISG